MQQQGKLQEKKRWKWGTKNPQGDSQSNSPQGVCVEQRIFRRGDAAGTWEADGTFGARSSGLVAEATAGVSGERPFWDTHCGPWGIGESQDGKCQGETP